MTTAFLAICFGGATVSCSGGIVPVGERNLDGGYGGSAGSTGTGGVATGSGGSATGAGGVTTGSGGNGAGGTTTGFDGGDGLDGGVCVQTVLCATDAHFDFTLCRCVPSDQACVSGIGGHCGGNIANPCTCSTGLVCTPGDSGLPSGDVGGTCQRARDTDAGSSLITCAATDHVCACAGGAYCIRQGGDCLGPQSPCPPGPSTLVCGNFEQVCNCQVGAYCLFGAALCISPTSPCAVK